jgi:hypothetical protein
MRGGAFDVRHDVLEQFNPLTAQRCLDVYEPRDIPVWARQARDEPAPNRVRNDDEHDRDRFGLALQRGDHFGGMSQDHIGFACVPSVGH